MKRSAPNRTAYDRTAYQPKPVERIEVEDGHIKKRTILLIIAIVVAVAAFAYGIANYTHVDTGWREIEIDTKEMNCSQDFVFNYYLGGGGASALSEYRALVSLYSTATERAYRIFNSYEAFTGGNNLYAVNQSVNAPVHVDPVLYQAFELIERLDSRYVYLAPVYAEYHSLFFCNEDWETEGYDPYQNADIREYFAQAAAFAQDPEQVHVELLGNNTLQLNVSEEYAAFAEENGISTYVDFFWMKDAFIVDFLANTMENSGYTRGAISSYDGFVRCLSDEQLSYSYHFYDLLQGSSICNAARLNYTGGTSLVHLHSFPIDPSKEIYYYQFEDGAVRHAYADLSDGLSKAAVPAMIATSREMGCAETLLRLLPLYAADTLDQDGLAQLTAEGIFPLYSVDRRIITSSPEVMLDDVLEGYEVVAP